MIGSKHVLAISIGPVQDFIAQARRTRDLWFGSLLLSELSKAAANAIAQSGTQLVFPALEAGSDALKPVLGKRGHYGMMPANVSNKILAITSEGIDPRTIARVARDAAVKLLEETAGKVRTDCSAIIAEQATEAWREQIETFLEFAAAWAPLESEDSYAEARERAEAELASRKGLREFVPWTAQRGAVPKSSLDGARETILRRFSDEADIPDVWRRLRISRGEQLDAIGLVKRAGGSPEQFVPLGNIALARWLLRAKDQAPEELHRLTEAARKLGLQPIARDFKWVRAFPFDAHLCHPDRLRPMFAEAGISEDPKVWQTAHLDSLLKQMPAVPAYVACVVADGDWMGRTIDSLRTASASYDFGEQIARFAAKVRDIVEGADVCGVLVYAGGDDVLAFVPVEDALVCADKLRRAFAECVASGLPTDMRRPTLSVGIGIGHFMENMGYLLELGRQAEQIAKGAAGSESEKNALGIVVEKRSGGSTTWRAQWTDDPVSRLQIDQGLLGAGSVPVGKVYEVARSLRRFPAPDVAGASTFGNMLVLDTLRTLRRSESRDGEAAFDPAQAGLSIPTDLPYGEAYLRVGAWVNRLMIAKTINDSSLPLMGAGARA